MPRNRKKRARKVSREKVRANAINSIGYDRETLSESDCQFADSLRKQYMENGGALTETQWQYVFALVRRKKTRSRKRIDRSETFLYFISDNIQFVKIGISRTPDKRLRDLQVSCPSTLHILKTFLFHSLYHAKLTENKLHKKCRLFLVQGEWFRLECLSVAESALSKFTVVIDGKRKYSTPKSRRGKLAHTGGSFLDTQGPGENGAHPEALPQHGIP